MVHLSLGPDQSTNDRMYPLWPSSMIVAEIQSYSTASQTLLFVECRVVI